jgi:Dihydrodipicolinate synthase/N-acetylneuraminate lyase
VFTGLSAFPITPFKQEVIDYKAFKGLVENLASANVDSICAIGSTGLYPYLTRGGKVRRSQARRRPRKWHSCYGRRWGPENL